MPAQTKRAAPVKKSNKPAKIRRPGLLHHRLFLPAAVFLVGIAGLGAYIVTSSSAASGSYSCTITSSPAAPRKGSSVTVTTVFKNNSGTYWNGTAYPQLYVINPYSKYIIKRVSGGNVSGLASGQSTTRKLTMTVPTNSGTWQLTSDNLGNTSSYGCVKSWSL